MFLFVVLLASESIVCAGECILGPMTGSQPENLMAYWRRPDSHPSRAAAPTALRPIRVEPARLGRGDSAHDSKFGSRRRRQEIEWRRRLHLLARAPPRAANLIQICFHAITTPASPIQHQSPQSPIQVGSDSDSLNLILFHFISTKTLSCSRQGAQIPIGYDSTSLAVPFFCSDINYFLPPPPPPPYSRSRTRSHSYSWLSSALFSLSPESNDNAPT